MGRCWFVTLLTIMCVAQGAPPPVPDPVLECALKAVLYNVSIARLPWFTSPERIFAALQLDLCPQAASPVIATTRSQSHQAPALPRALRDNPHSIFVHAHRGSDSALGQSEAAPLRTLRAARSQTHALRAALGKNSTVTVHLSGMFYEHLLLDSALDSRNTWKQWAGQPPAVISGGIPLALTWGPSDKFPAPVVAARLPAGVPTADMYSLFDAATGRRLPLAREPNGDPETMMQPHGYALARGNINGSLPLPPGVPATATHREVDRPRRNSSAFPVWGRDYDPRTLPSLTGYVWYGEDGGPAVWMEGNRTFWANKTLPGGLVWNATGGVDPHSGLRADGFNATGWASVAPGRRAHVFHSALWGNWVFDVAAVDTASSTMTFARGGWQEGRGGGMGTQPFFVEGEARALDAPGEWWIDSATGLLHLWPNASSAPALLVLPVMETVLSVRSPAAGVVLEGLSFQHTIDGLMGPYAVPEAGDWSVRKAASVEVDGAADISMVRCQWLRVGGNGLLVTGAASRILVQDSEFLLPGSSGVVVVGTVPAANITADLAAPLAYPTEVTVSRCLFEGIGVLGKQSSALFVSVACNVTLADSVLYSGPRAGVNINDGFCGGHQIVRSVIFDWVRETQDHGPINTWRRSMYADAVSPATAATPLWFRVTHNAIFNGPSPNRDLGNLFPAVDNDDGSSMFWVAANLMVYGGGKNYLGSDKVWDSNLIVIPERWSGDPCLCAWRGEHHVFTNNTCITPLSGSPNAYDSSLSGDVCVADYANSSQIPFLPLFAHNTYVTFQGKFGEGCDGTTTLAELQALGQELGSSVASSYSVDAVVAHANALLSV